MCPQGGTENGGCSSGDEEGLKGLCQRKGKGEGAGAIARIRSRASPPRALNTPSDALPILPSSLPPRVRNTYIYPPTPSLRIISDIMGYT